ncbi:hypothetical protein SDC9_142612 [bioreactor metagenome]|uniref:Uncharacterized protein n=1 Tax=bioreactor metagenome TaxID=1076179 RepID=A0A645E240_9ZZZZ
MPEPQDPEIRIHEQPCQTLPVFGLRKDFHGHNGHHIRQPQDTHKRMGGLSARLVQDAELQLSIEIKQKQRHNNELLDIQTLPYTQGIPRYYCSQGKSLHR